MSLYLSCLISIQASTLDAKPIVALILRKSSYYSIRQIDYIGAVMVGNATSYCNAKASSRPRTLKAAFPRTLKAAFPRTLKAAFPRTLKATRGVGATLREGATVATGLGPVAWQKTSSFRLRSF